MFRLLDYIRRLVSPRGLTAIAEGGDVSDPSRLPMSRDDCSVFAASEDQNEYQCGHTGPKTFRLNMWGLESKEFAQKERCPSCFLERFKQYSIRCVLCGLPIFPGEAVALYHESGGKLRREIGTKVKDSYLGCLRWDCCPSGGFFAGHWTEEGFRPGFPDGLTSAELAFKTGKIVVSNP